MSKWPGSSFAQVLGVFHSCVADAGSLPPTASCRQAELPGTWPFQSGLKGQPPPLGLPPASRATLKFYPPALVNGPFPWR